MTSTVLLSLIIVVVWAFPRFWYTKTDPEQGFYWLAEQTNLPGWKYRTVPVGEAAEAALAADRIVNGEFVREPSERGRRDRTVVRVFSAKRYAARESEFDMFSHTPDRCWTSVGWKLESAPPETVALSVHGVPMRLERRVFVAGMQRELVYFGALVGGQPLPYRLDQYLDVGIKRTEETPGGVFGKMLGAMDARLFGWPWKSFVNRRPLFGPKQFVRISTPIMGDTRAADALLGQFLSEWLSLADYRKELAQWRGGVANP